MVLFFSLPYLAQAADEVGVSVTVTKDDIIIVHPIYGCTDKEAENYNSKADKDDGSCLYVPAATNFIGVYNLSGRRVNLSWTNPADFANFAGVRIVRTTGSLSSGPADGTVVYDGSGESARDPNVQIGVTYFYALYVRSTTGHYSTAAIAIVTPRDGLIEEGDDDDDSFGGFGRATSTDPLIIALDLGDFIFSQPGEPAQYFGPGGSVYIKGDKQFTVTLSYEKVPEVLKTIGLTLVDPTDPTKTFSFLLRLNAVRTAYTATVAPLGRTGVYNLHIYVMNFKDQTMKRISGRLVVATAGNVPLDFKTARVVGQGAVVAAGVLALILQTLGITYHFNSLLDLYLIFMRLIGVVLGWLGLKKKSRPWGTVYDAVTKRPIDPAYVSVSRVAGGQEITSAITDIDGRYGFFLTAGEYLLSAGKTHYRFPSVTLKGKERDELYSDLYFGEPIRVEGEEVVNKNIPLDPVGFDWNEFAKLKSEFFKVYSRKEIKRQHIFTSLYVIGFLVSVGSFILTPSWFDIATIFIYIGLFILQSFWTARHRPVQIRRKESGEPVPFAIIRFFLPGLVSEVRSVVADELGRFFTLLRPETYFYTIEEKRMDGSYETVFRSEPVALPRGILTGEIVV